MRKLITPVFSLDGAIGIDAGPNANPPGIICAANEARFTSSHYSEPLTGYTVGWRDPNDIDGIIARLFPEIPSPRRYEFKAATNAEEFLTDDDDERPNGGAFKRVDRKGTTVYGKTKNRGLTVRVDHDDVDELDGAWREAYVQWLLRRLARSRLKRGIAVLDAAATNAAVTWTGANPDGLLRAMLTLGANASGVRANVVAIGQTAWDLRADVYEAANTPYAGVAAQKTPQELARKLGVSLVELLDVRYATSPTAKSQILGSVAYSYFAEQGQMKDDPSNVKRFTSKARGGQSYGVYVQEHEKFTDISVEYYDDIMAATSLGCRKATIS